MNVSLGSAVRFVVRNILFIAGWFILVGALHAQVGDGFFGLIFAGAVVTVWMVLASRVVARVVARKL
ncbi:MAG: hypothetical protein H9W81_07570 [Enterococcus sp.]|nr:hypothetical protein [Enterococcus sp.]